MDSVSQKSEAIAETESSCVETTAKVVPWKKELINNVLLSKKPMLKRCDIVVQDTYDMQAKGQTATMAPWSFIAVTTLPLKKRFINITWIGATIRSPLKRYRCDGPLEMVSDEFQIAKKIRLAVNTGPSRKTMVRYDNIPI